MPCSTLSRVRTPMNACGGSGPGADKPDRQASRRGFGRAMRAAGGGGVTRQCTPSVLRATAGRVVACGGEWLLGSSWLATCCPRGCPFWLLCGWPGCCVVLEPRAGLLPVLEPQTGRAPSSASSGPTLADARTPIYRAPPAARWQHASPPESESLGMVIGVRGSGLHAAEAPPSAGGSAARTGRPGAPRACSSCSSRCGARWQPAQRCHTSNVRA